MKARNLAFAVSVLGTGIACNALTPSDPERATQESVALAQSAAPDASADGGSDPDLLDTLVPTLGAISQKAQLRRNADAALNDLFAHFWYDDPYAHRQHIAPTFYGRFWGEAPPIDPSKDTRT